jgi:tRNA(Ile)-lysidine synthase TilS/MesJ
MNKWESNVYLKKLRQAVDHFQLIKPGDRILVGVSGGKDSTLLLYGLSQLRKVHPYNFEVEGLIVNHGMLGNMETYLTYCKDLGLKLTVHTELYAESLGEENGFSPCYTCSRLRKGIVKRIALEKEFNAIAYGHTLEDVVETFFMNIVKQGKIAGIPALSQESESEIKLIRPLILLDEVAIQKAIEILGIPLMHDTCTFAHGRVRDEAEKVIQRIEETYPAFSEQVVKALQNVDLNRLL